ncbi:hypothetical protein JGY70_002459 [Salmonella enterica]|nr:hypothetical protein [Salmonella enterica]
MSNIDKQELRERYSSQPVPKCHICGAEMTVQRISSSRITYGCTGATYDDAGCHYAEGRSIADYHYEQSRVTIVDYSDPEVLMLLDELEDKDKRIAGLAAENAHARERHIFIRALAVSILEHSGGRMDWRGAMEDATELLQTVDSVYAKTPATDSFLAEMRAQVWIEGSEPEEFGRYWVRYETDVGPQYCSAKWMEHNFCAGSNTNIHKIWLADHSRSINSLRGVTHYTKLPDSLEGAAQ